MYTVFSKAVYGSVSELLSEFLCVFLGEKI